MDFPRNLFIETVKNEGHTAQFLTDTLGYVDNLTQNHLPVIFSLKHFSLLLGLEPSGVKALIENRNYHYSPVVHLEK